jgi:hypothetical protein
MLLGTTGCYENYFILSVTSDSYVRKYEDSLLGFFVV